MAKKRKSGAGNDQRKKQQAAPVFNSPFKDLKKLLKERETSHPPKLAKSAANSLPVNSAAFSAAKPSPSAQATDDAALLREALAGVRPLAGALASRVAVERPAGRGVISEDAEVLAELSDLVSGQGRFELTETEEYVEGMRVGLDPRVLTRLRRGEFSTQSHIDLHGMTQPDAKAALTQFILDSVRKGHRAVLVIHGRGLRSPRGEPVLKHATAQWLSHGTVGGYVLAFATARPYDGGAGAVWVLLRRERKRGKFDILQGAKRRD